MPQLHPIKKRLPFMCKLSEFIDIFYLTTASHVWNSARSHLKKVRTYSNTPENMIESAFTKITQEFIDGFNANVKNITDGVISLFKKESGDQSSADKNLLTLTYELCVHVVNGNVKPDVAASIFSSVKSDITSQRSCIISNVLWALGLQVENCESLEEKHLSAEWKNLTKLVVELQTKDVVSASQLKTNLELSLLEHAKLIKSASVTRKTMVKVNTKRVYTQTKFNLLWEESEGYSKLITTLNQKVNKNNVENITMSVKNIVGQFNLDPNRVCDIVLQSFEWNQSRLYLDVLKLFRCHNICQVLGFNFSYYHTESIEAPRYLCRAAAVLVSTGIITFEDIWPHLHPSDEELASAQEAKRVALTSQAKKIGVVSLNASSKKEDVKISEKLATTYTLLNSKFGMLKGLLDLGLWDNAQQLFRRFSAMHIYPHMDIDVQKSIAHFLEHMISKLYREHILSKLPKIASPRRENSKTKRRYDEGMQPYEVWLRCFEFFFSEMQ